MDVMHEHIVMLTIRELSKKHNYPEHALRRHVNLRELPAVRTGKKFLVCEAVFLDFLVRGNNQPSDAHDPKPFVNKIRPLRVVK